jgi:hypothetical protein
LVELLAHVLTLFDPEASLSRGKDSASGLSRPGSGPVKWHPRLVCAPLSDGSDDRDFRYLVASVAARVQRDQFLAPENGDRDGL